MITLRPCGQFFIAPLGVRTSKDAPRPYFTRQRLGNIYFDYPKMVCVYFIVLYSIKIRLEFIHVDHCGPRPFLCSRSQKYLWTRRTSDLCLLKAARLSQCLHCCLHLHHLLPQNKKRREGGCHGAAASTRTRCCFTWHSCV